MLKCTYRIVAITACVCLAMAQVGRGADWVLSRFANDHRLLSLIRQPVVVDELALNAEQCQRLDRLNQRLDGPLLSLRNWRTEAARKRLTQITTETNRELAAILTRPQINRLAQVTFYAAGYRTAAYGRLSQTLQVDKEQQQAIAKIVKANDLIFSRRGQADSWTDAAKIKTALAEEDRRVLAVLNEAQRRKLNELAGRKFDRERLTGIRIRAPEFAAGKWLNAKGGLKMQDLRGSIVVVHFWAFG